MVACHKHDCSRPKLRFSSSLGLERRSFIPKILKQCRAQIAFSEAGQDQHDPLPRVLRSLPDLDGRAHRGPARDAAEYPLLIGEPPRHGAGVLSGDLHHLVQQRGVGVAWDEARADALDFVRAGLAAAQHRWRGRRRVSERGETPLGGRGRKSAVLTGFGGFDSHYFHIGVARLKELPASR